MSHQTAYYASYREQRDNTSFESGIRSMRAWNMHKAMNKVVLEDAGDLICQSLFTHFVDFIIINILVLFSKEYWSLLFCRTFNRAYGRAKRMTEISSFKGLWNEATDLALHYQELMEEIDALKQKKSLFRTGRTKEGVDDLMISFATIQRSIERSPLTTEEKQLLKTLTLQVSVKILRREIKKAYVSIVRDVRNIFRTIIRFHFKNLDDEGADVLNVTPIVSIQHCPFKILKSETRYTSDQKRYSAAAVAA